ncbi:HAMP domain-containing protein [Achromobacter sp. B7]|uniref:methyl-accepting chemotaxis protein n=1 Tax=Achromobacter sp. B7 TaxID=2282475 RepID=UPI000E7126E3|nr:methyl-accepting chemotaxis protein [Achromobacter sp. B7]AYD64409.1 HAMP domain-containing protein [Achromobacter sp. B7]
MFTHLKVRSCLGILLALFFTGMLVANGAAWLDTRSSNAKLGQVNEAYSMRVVPVYEAYTLMLRARLAMDAAMINRQVGRITESDADAARAEDLWRRSRERFDAFASEVRAPALQEKAAPVAAAFKLYDSLAAEQFESMRGQDARAFALQMDAVQGAHLAFDHEVAGYLRYVDAQTNGFVEAAATQHVRANTLIAALLAVAVLLSIGAALFVSRSVLRPLLRAGAHFQSIADGNLTNPIEIKSHNEMGQLFLGLQRMQASLAKTVAAVRQSVHQISHGTRDIAEGNVLLSSRTEQQAATLEETALSMGRLAVTVKENADNALRANQLAEGASQVAGRGAAVVADVVGTMQDISASSAKITHIVSVIDGIAFQTNILALNAAVEAARAGDQGKGFAVVAGEVRALAQRSALAAREIKQLIADSAGRVQAGAQQVALAGETMREIESAVHRVTDIMGEIAAASSEQAQGIDQVNLAVSSMDEATQQNAALVEQAAASARALRDQAEGLAQTVAVFTVSPRVVIDMPDARVSNASTANQTNPARAGAPRKRVALQRPASAPAPAGLGAAVQDDWQVF